MAGLVTTWEDWVGSPKFAGMKFITGVIKPITVYDTLPGQ